MKDIIALALVILGVAQFWMLSYNIITLLVLFALCFLGGLLYGLDNKPTNPSADEDIAALAQIERNRYHRKSDQ